MSLVSRLLHLARISALLSVVLMLTACEQPEAVSPAETPESAIEHAAEAEPVTGVTSIDADGNIAPFGFASRQPVHMVDPMPAAPPTPTTSSSGLYAIHCVACHGADADGVDGLGVSLLSSDLVAGSSEAELIGFLQIGRPINSPDNTSGVPMPSFSWMDAEQLREITQYLRSLHGR